MAIKNGKAMCAYGGKPDSKKTTTFSVSFQIRLLNSLPITYDEEQYTIASLLNLKFNLPRVPYEKNSHYVVGINTFYRIM